MKTVQRHWYDRLKKDVIRDKWLYIMLLPGMVYFLVFKYGAMYGLIIAFMDYNPFRGIGGSPFVGLENFSQKNVRSFSFGMKQRLALAQAILTEPALLILDEPFVGLDPIGIEDVKTLLRRLCRKSQTTIIFSSHQLTEVCDLADDIMVLKGGEICYFDTYSHTKEQQTSLVDLMR